MSRIAPDLWPRLAQGRLVGAQLSARAPVPDLTERLLCALDSQGQRHLLITLDEQHEEFKDANSRGLRVETRELVIRGQGTGRYLDIECRDPAGYPVLDLIGNELLQELSQSDRQPAEITRRVPAKWRRFWGQIPRTLLSREDQLGLFGELWFLHLWVTPAVGLQVALQRWRGPFGARHDFEWPTRSVEVKATTSTRGRIHRINGIDQLLPPDQGDLLVFSMRLREEAGATNSLPALIARIRDDLQADPDTLGLYEAALLQAGYSPVHEEEYSKTRLRIIEERLFVVRADFPRLTPQSFAAGVPPGVERVDYEINLGSSDHLCVARTPGEAAKYF